MASKNVQTAQSVHKAFNEHDWEAIKKVVADDCVWVDGRGISHKGPEGVAITYSKAWADAFSKGKITEAKYYDAGDVVISEFVGRGVNDGALGPIPATNRSVDLPYCEIYRFDSSGKVRSGSSYFDQLTMLVQLGLAEAPPA